MSLPQRHGTLAILAAFNILLAVLYLMTNLFLPAPPHAVVQWFDLDGEASIAAWFSSSQLLIIFFLSILYAPLAKDALLARLYILVGMAFLLLSADESIMIHERLGVLQEVLAINSPFPKGHGAWIFVYSAILLAGAIIFRRNVVAFFGETAGRQAFLAGVGLFALGSVVFEIIGYYLTHQGASKSLLYLLEVCAEEGFEMLGESLLIFSLLTKIEAAQNPPPAAIGHAG